MNQRYLAAALAVMAVVVLPLGASAQSGDAPRTPWGKPDLQGVWDFATMTPLERPAQYAGKTTLTEEDAAAVVEDATLLWGTHLGGWETIDRNLRRILVRCGYRGHRRSTHVADHESVEWTSARAYANGCRARRGEASLFA